MALQDPRTARTRARLRQAMTDSLAAGDLETTTVASLCRLAGVQRTTFYGHYQDVGDLLVEVLTEDLDRILTAPDMTGMALDAMAVEFQETLVAAFASLAARRDAFRAAFASSLSERMRTSLEQMLTRRLRIALQIWHRHGAATDVDESVAVPFCSAGIAASIASYAVGDGRNARVAADAVRDQMPPWWPRPGTGA